MKGNCAKSWLIIINCSSISSLSTRDQLNRKKPRRALCKLQRSQLAIRLSWHFNCTSRLWAAWFMFHKAKCIAIVKANRTHRAVIARVLGCRNIVRLRHRLAVGDQIISARKIKKYFNFKFQNNLFSFTAANNLVSWKRSPNEWLVNRWKLNFKWRWSDEM